MDSLLNYLPSCHSDTTEEVGQRIPHICFECLMKAVNWKHVISNSHSSLKQYLEKCINCSSQRELELERNITDQCLTEFDGYECWFISPPGNAAQNCPSHILDFDPSQNASKVCLSNNMWDNRTSYNSCYSTESYEFHLFVSRLGISCNCLSAITVLISLIIFLSFDTLSSCTRVRVHIHLFLSYLPTHIMWALWEADILPTTAGNVVCKIYFLVANYFTVTNYFWMLCEGVHLFLVLKIVFISEQRWMKIFYFIGWAMPAIIMALYAVFRFSLLKEANIECDEQTEYFLIVKVFVLISLVINLVILVVVVILLLDRPGRNSPSIALARAIRASFILIPLLGIQYLVYLNAPDEVSIIYKPYIISETILTSIQGFLVAAIFCLANREVHRVLQAALTRRRRSGSLRPATLSDMVW